MGVIVGNDRENGDAFAVDSVAREGSKDYAMLEGHTTNFGWLEEFGSRHDHIMSGINVNNSMLDNSNTLAMPFITYSYIADNLAPILHLQTLCQHTRMTHTNDIPILGGEKES